MAGAVPNEHKYSAKVKFRHSKQQPIVLRCPSSLQPLSQRSNCCRSRKCIRWHIPVHAIFAVFYLFFLLGHLSLLGLQTKTRRQRNSSTFCSFKCHNPETFMSSAATAFVHATLKRSQKVPRAKSGTFWFPRMDSHDSSTIQ